MDFIIGFVIGQFSIIGLIILISVAVSKEKGDEK